MKSAHLLAVFFVILLALPIQSKEKSVCKGNQHIVDECFTFHGRLFYSNGTPSVRIWRVGTKRILGVWYSEDEIMPDYISQYADFNTNITQIFSYVRSQKKELVRCRAFVLNPRVT